MSDLTAPPPTRVEHDSPPSRPPRRTRWVAALIAAAVLVGAGVVIALVGHGGGQGRVPPGRRGPSAAAIAARRDRAIRGLLARSGRAMARHDRARFAATLASADPGFRRAALRRFDNAVRVPFGSWTYAMNVHSEGRIPRRLQREAVGSPVYAPASVTLRYRIAGFDTAPVTVDERAVFVEEPGGGWRLLSLAPTAGPDGARPVATPWQFGPVEVVRAPGVLVLGPARELTTMREVAQLASAAIPHVTAFWGRRWARRAVLEVPATPAQMGELTGFTGDLAPIAALTSAEIHTVGRSQPVGDRVVVNPVNWLRMSPVGRAIVITHELTHVASRADTSADTPKWLSEGLAEWVSFSGSGVPVSTGAYLLDRRVRAGRLPGRLPGNHAFAGSATRLDLAYDEAWLACLTIAERWGPRRLVAFYRAVGTSDELPAQAVSSALHRVLHISGPAFLAAWRMQLRAAFG